MAAAMPWAAIAGRKGSGVACFGCGLDLRGYECRKCHLVSCLTCLEKAPPERPRGLFPHHLSPRRRACPSCGYPLRPQLGCYLCGKNRPRFLFLCDPLDWHCFPCGLHFCSECAAKLPTHAEPLLESAPVCPSCNRALHPVGPDSL